MKIARCCSALLLALTIGCDSGHQQKFEVIPPKTPLTVEQWRQLPVAEKYDVDTFERLKLNDPKLKDEQAWNTFMRDVIVPERKIDIPQPPK